MPFIPLLPTTIRSASTASAVSQIAFAGSWGRAWVMTLSFGCSAAWTDASSRSTSFFAATRH